MGKEQALLKEKLRDPGLSNETYRCQVEIEGHPVANGTGLNKVQAREDAAKKAFLFLGKENAVKYNSLLQLFLMLEGLDRCEFNNITSCQIFIYRVLDGNKVLGEGAGLTSSEAKEIAAREAYFHLIKIETEKAESREMLKRGERPKPLTPKTTTMVKQRSVEVSHLPQNSVSKMSSPKQIIEKSARKKSINKRPEKATQSQRKIESAEKRSNSPSPKSQTAIKDCSREASKLSKKPAANQPSPNINRNNASNKKPVILQKDILKPEDTSLKTHI